MPNLTLSELMEAFHFGTAKGMYAYGHLISPPNITITDKQDNCFLYPSCPRSAAASR